MPRLAIVKETRECDRAVCIPPHSHLIVSGGFDVASCTAPSSEQLNGWHECKTPCPLCQASFECCESGSTRTARHGAPGRMSREEVLMHVITHGIGHRGQVSAVMLLNAVPPAKDGFTTYLHEAEASTRGRTAA